MTGLRFRPCPMLFSSILHIIFIPKRLVNNKYAIGSDTKTVLSLTHNTADLRSWWLIETNKPSNYNGILFQYKTSVLFQEHMTNQLYKHNTTLTNVQGRKFIVNKVKKRFFFTPAQQPPVGQGLLIIEDSRSHPDTSHSVGLLWMSDQLEAETSTWQHTTLTTDIHSPGGIRTQNSIKLAAADQRLRQRGHWDRQGDISVVDYTENSDSSATGVCCVSLYRQRADCFI
jgi:hypothetical protein